MPTSTRSTAARSRWPSPFQPALDHVADAELAADLPRVVGLVAVAEARAGRDGGHAEAGQVGDDVLDQRVREAA